MNNRERILIAWLSACLLSLAITTVLARVFGLGGAQPFVVTTLLAGMALALAWRGQATQVVTGTPLCAAMLALVVGFPNDIPVWLVMTLAATLPYPPIFTFVAPRHEMKHANR